MRRARLARIAKKLKLSITKIKLQHPLSSSYTFGVLSYLIRVHGEGRMSLKRPFSLISCGLVDSIAYLIDVITVSEAILTSREPHEKLQCVSNAE